MGDRSRLRRSSLLPDYAAQFVRQGLKLLAGDGHGILRGGDGAHNAINRAQRPKGVGHQIERAGRLVELVFQQRIVD